MKTNLPFTFFFLFWVLTTHAQGLNASFNISPDISISKANETLFYESTAIKNGDVCTISHLKNPFSASEINSFVALSVSAEHNENTPISFEVRYLNDGTWSSWEPLSNSFDIGGVSKTISQIVELPKTFSEAELRVKGAVSIIKARLYNPKPITQPVEKSSVPPVPAPLSCPCSQPSYTTRSQWNCPDGNSASCSPYQTSSVNHLIVHHEAGSNSSSDWGARVNAIWDLHVNTNGWCDIGYNWLIAPTGELFQGRGGSGDVVGAHFCGMNTYTMGVCFLGNMQTASPSNSALNTLYNLFAWKCCMSDINPTGSSYLNGTLGTVNNILGHRDGCSTTCPGDNLYNLLSTIKSQTQNTIDNCSVQGGTPSNDNCSGATTLQLGSTCSYTAGTNVGATESSVADLICSPPSNVGNTDVWYKVTLPQGITNVTFQTANMVQTGGNATYDLIMGIYSGSCNNLSLIQCVDNNGQSNGPPATTINMSSYGGQTIYIRIQEAGTVNDYGTFDICVFGTVPCTYQLTPSTQTVSASAGSTTFDVSAGNSCSWSASESCNWITLSNSSGTGDGTVTVNYQQNTSVNSRTCTITVQGQTFTITQPGITPCTYSISPSSENVSAASGSTSFDITVTGSNCSWTATESCSWITLANASGTQSGTITVNYQQNTSIDPRSCTITVGGQTYTITQDGVTQCTYSLSPTSETVTPSAGSTTFTVNTDVNCSWTATESCNWITLTGNSGTGNGLVTVNYQQNTTGIDRTCTITLNGETFVINQPATPPCAFTLTPTSETVTDLSGSTSFNVTTDDNCSWTATESCAWVSLSTASGNGNGNVIVNYQQNNTGNSRSCTITVNGETFTLTQSAPVTCDYLLSTNAQQVNSNSGSTTFDVFTDSNCDWQGTENCSWVLLSNASGTGNGTVVVNYQQNTGAIRSCTIAVENQTFVLTQEEGTTGLSEEESKPLYIIYPNPTNGNIFLTLNEDIGNNINIALFNALGQLVFSENLNNLSVGQTKELPVSQLANGLYFVNLQTTTQSYKSKLIVK